MATKQEEALAALKQAHADEIEITGLDDGTLIIKVIARKKPAENQERVVSNVRSLGEVWQTGVCSPLPFFGCICCFFAPFATLSLFLFKCDESRSGETHDHPARRSTGRATAGSSD